MVSIVGFKTISSSVEFNSAYKKGSVKHTQEFVVFYLASKHKRVAFVAGKKVGNAVKRNRAKRLLRALFIANSNRLNHGFYIFVAKPKLLDEQYDVLQNRFFSALNKVGALKTLHS